MLERSIASTWWILLVFLLVYKICKVVYLLDLKSYFGRYPSSVTKVTLPLDFTSSRTIYVYLLSLNVRTSGFLLTLAAFPSLPTPLCVGRACDTQTVCLRQGKSTRFLFFPYLAHDLLIFCWIFFKMIFTTHQNRQESSTTTIKAALKHNLDTFFFVRCGHTESDLNRPFTWGPPKYFHFDSQCLL